MYTKCPECRTAFRVTVTVLRKAHGRVRCGGCGHVFDAIEHLHDEAAGDEPEIGATGVRQRFVEQSEELLKSLDELAGPDEIRIEDTGVEWRVFDADDESGDDDGTDAARDDTMAADPDATEVRYDDNTPLPDDETEQSGGDAANAMPGHRAEDWQPPPLAHDPQVDLALGEPGDWQALLEEVATDRPDDTAGADAGDGPAFAGGAREDDLTAAAATDRGPAGPADATAATVAQPTGNWMLIDDTGTCADAGGTRGPSADNASPRPDDESFEAAASRQLDAAFAEAAPAVDSGDDDDQASIDKQIDEDLLRAVAEGGASQSGRYRAPDTGASGLFETIVMEGDSIRDTENDDEDDNKTSDAGTLAVASLESASASSPERAGADEPPGRSSAWPRVAAAILLGLLLGGQLVHANRETLATRDSIDRVLGPVYRALGKTVTPQWNIRGWRFESTSGSADAADEVLTIRSRIANRSGQPLPLPLVHVSLTDRYEEIIGSRVLEAADYLPDGAGANRPIAPGGAFTAVITIASPSAAATGFKLNVCYPYSGEQLRCAVEAFRD